MMTFIAKAVSTSRHPQDWGRAIAIALDDLVSQSQKADTGLDTAELFGADLTLHIERQREGAALTLTWDRPAPA